MNKLNKIKKKLRVRNEPIPSRPPRAVLGSSESSESHKSSSSINATSNLRVIFTVHIDRTPDDNDLQSLVGWVRSLDPFLGLELTGVQFISVNFVDIFLHHWRV